MVDEIKVISDIDICNNCDNECENFDEDHNLCCYCYMMTYGDISVDDLCAFCQERIN